MDFVIPFTIPVKLGLLIGDLPAKALIDAVLNGFNKSDVLSTLAKLTMDFVIPPSL